MTKILQSIKCTSLILVITILAVTGSPWTAVASTIAISPGMLSWEPTLIAQISDQPNNYDVHPKAKEYALDVFLPHMWDNTKNTFLKPKHLALLGLGGLAAWGVSTQDEKINSFWGRTDMAYPLAEIGNAWGAGYFPAALSLGMYAWGRTQGNQQLATNAEVLAEALILQGIVINAIKPIVGRERPLGQDNLAFPSGHTGCAFVTAAVLQDRYGYKLGIPAYALAALTGLARMDVQVHWASDVVMGATIGSLTGYAVSKFHDDFPYKRAWTKNSRLMPIIQGGQENRLGLILLITVD